MQDLDKDVLRLKGNFITTISVMSIIILYDLNILLIIQCQRFDVQYTIYIYNKIKPRD